MIENKKSWIDFYETEGNDIFDKLHAFSEFSEQEDKAGNIFFRRPILGSIKNEVLVYDKNNNTAKKFIMMGSNSYLGLTSDLRVINAAKDATEKYGTGTGAVSLFAGTTDLHLKLEKKIADFYKTEEAILFPTGYAANVGVITAILRENDMILGDILNHASIYDGIELSKAKKKIYAHRNLKHLEVLLSRVNNNRGGNLIITDGVFSMDGDVAPLDKIYELALKYNSRVMIDEAHALGVIGKTGKGTAEYFGLEGKIDITVGSLSKTAGAIGGFAAGKRELIDYLRYYARPYFYSTSIPTNVVAGLIEVFNIIETDKQLFDNLWKNVDFMKQELLSLGFDIGNTESAVIPIMVNCEEKLKQISKDLDARGIFMNYVSFPAVSKKRCRLRMNISALHTQDDLLYVLDVLKDLGKKYELIEGSDD